MCPAIQQPENGKPHSIYTPEALYVTSTTIISDAQIEPSGMFA
jgi:hypothetical protein